MLKFFAILLGSAVLLGGCANYEAKVNYDGADDDGVKKVKETVMNDEGMKRDLDVGDSDEKVQVIEGEMESEEGEGEKDEERVDGQNGVEESGANSEIEEQLEERENSLRERDNGMEGLYACGNIDQPFAFGDEGASGVFKMTGTVISEEGLRPFTEGETVNYVRLVASGGSEEAVSYFAEMVESGNSVNRIDENGNLKFKLGTLENGELSSTAIVGPADERAILEAVESGEEINLEMKLPLYLGRGAPAEFSFACEIEVLEA